MIENSVRDASGKVIGFRCDTCDKIKTKMWGTICNLCRAKFNVQISNDVGNNDLAVIADKATRELDRAREFYETRIKLLMDWAREDLLNRAEVFDIIANAQRRPKVVNREGGAE